jgi:hypothetical protein
MTRADYETGAMWGVFIRGRFIFNAQRSTFDVVVNSYQLGRQQVKSSSKGTQDDHDLATR